MPEAGRAPLGPAPAPQEAPRAARDVQCSPFAPRIQGAVCAGLRAKRVPKALPEQDFVIASGWENVLNSKHAPFDFFMIACFDRNLNFS